jgi:hypothetical protein
MMCQFFLACQQQSLCMLLSHLVLLHESYESRTLLGRVFCVAHCTLLNMEFVTASYQYELICVDFTECLSNAIEIFFRGPCLSRFYMQQITCSPQFVVPAPNAFP